MMPINYSRKNAFGVLFTLDIDTRFLSIYTMFCNNGSTGVSDIWNGLNFSAIFKHRNNFIC